MKRASRKTKIVATVGPASSSATVVEELIRRGANVFRLNFSHGSHESHARSAELIRRAARRLGVQVAIMADLQGPKIRTGATDGDEPVVLKKGTAVVVSRRAVRCDAATIHVDYPRLADEIEVGQSILLNDGAVALRALAIDRSKGEIRCRVLNTGSYSSHKGVNLPGVALSISAFTAKDRRDAKFALSFDPQFIALSFVRRADDLEPLRRLIRGSGKAVRLIAKIEKPEAAGRIEEIVEASDGIMVARGDLGVETSIEAVPIEQKRLIDAANRRGKIVIVATQMLESMISHPRPTRAESADVANAIIDGADAVMLSGETAVGGYPGEAVATMSRIAEATETSAYFPAQIVDLFLRKRYPPHALCEAAAWASRDLGHAPVLVFTVSGATALYLSKVRTFAPIYAFSPDEQVAAALSLCWNTTSFPLAINTNLVDLIAAAERLLLEKRFVKKGELVVIVCGTTPARGATNLLRVKEVGRE